MRISEVFVEVKARGSEAVPLLVIPTRGRYREGTTDICQAATPSVRVLARKPKGNRWSNCNNNIFLSRNRHGNRQVSFITGLWYKVCAFFQGE